ncbi:sulfotransferase family protein [Novilysobacter avium]|uniref:Sulfotransferase n=1 Tax=Novilysobacter avium TaxID=2781023 RepID=A0A7S6ZU55_9GAMM|nr:sulfotransferase [Lysobacter avium]QOW21678.1 sulfotransferase [Lysobacter avium]
MQLIVLGMHRSGTSTLARLLNLMGVYFGPEGMSTGANPENPKGFWERRDVRQLNDALLHSDGCDWNRISSYDADQTPEDVITRFEDHAGKLILEMDAHRPWLMKEPRLCLLLPHWKRVLEVPVCIHILRHPVEVASSLNKRNGMPFPAGLALWERHVRAALHAAADLPGILVSHHRLINDPMGTVERMHAQLVAHGVTGLHLPSRREIESFVTPKLHRERRDRPDLSIHLDTPQARWFDALITGSWPPAAVEAPSAAVNDTLREYESSLPPMDTTRPNLLLASGNRRQPEKDSFPGDRQTSRHAREILKLTRLALASEERFRHQIAKLEADASTASARANLTTGLEQAIDTLEQEKKQLAIAERLAQQDRTRSAIALERTTGELARSNKSLAAAEQQASQAKAELSGYRAKIQQMRRKHDRESNTHARHREIAAGMIQEYRVRVEHLIAAVESRENALRQLDRHPVWRLTAPLRRLASLVTGRRPPSVTSPLGILRDSELFDAHWYQSRYPDVATSGIDPARHYLDHGAAEGRDPSPHFNTRAYTDAHREVTITGENPLIHFIEQRRLLATMPAGAPHTGRDGEGDQ